MKPAGVPVRDALASAVIALSAAGVDAPQLDAQLLLAHALGVDRAALLLDPLRPVEGGAVRAFQNAVRRRSVQREPLAYITGRRGFRNLELLVDRRALIPRPETELLVEAALLLPNKTSVLDIGTGSGAIALALKDERPDLEVTGSDVSAEALTLARENALGLALDVRFVQADLLEGLPECQAIVCNPPYVEDRARLAPEITRHEPALALYGGPDGMALARRLIEQVASSSAWWLALEVGRGQAQTLASIAGTSGFSDVRVLPDLAGIDRVIVARR